ncbi:MAG: hypothetical protein PF638_13395 [Candidatus Delongbacteria bacterium]|jgi:hypothetical protein|nr:hypothetical protein [Candidatus Delongbacteria bacterium]
MKHAVAYIDLLGFSNFVNSNLSDAIKVLENYNHIIDDKIFDQKLDNKSKNSFKYFIPFSDSIFIASEMPNEFIKELADFFLACFKFTSDQYIRPRNSDSPEDIEVITNIIDKNGKTTQEKVIQKWYPILFRGGISFGEAHAIELNTINNSEYSKIKTLAGKAVVKSVGLECLEDLKGKIKGPRLICDKEFMDSITDSKIKFYIVKLKDFENLYEILWPAFHFINNKPYEIKKFNNLFIPISNFWKAYKNEKYGRHYLNFIKLLIESTLRFAENINETNNAIDYIKTQLKNNGMQSDIKYLFDLSS